MIYQKGVLDKMTGVEILYTEPIIATSIYNILAGILALGTFVFFIALLISLEYKRKIITRFFISAMVCCFICAIVFGAVGFKKPLETGRYQYEAIISEDVSLTDFYEKYEVVEQRGGIYVFEDKEIVNEK